MKQNVYGVSKNQISMLKRRQNFHTCLLSVPRRGWPSPLTVSLTVKVSVILDDFTLFSLSYWSFQKVCISQRTIGVCNITSFYFMPVVSGNSQNESLWFPFPNYGNGFCHFLPIPESWECFFSFPSCSRIVGMDFFHSLPVPEFAISQTGIRILFYLPDFQYFQLPLHFLQQFMLQR